MRSLIPRAWGVPVALALTLALVAGACSSGASQSPSSAGSSEPTSAASSTPASSASSEPSFDPLSPYPSKSGNLPSVKFAQSVPALSFAPFIVARRMNFFEYQGVKIEFVELQSGATSLQAVTGGSIDLSDSASTEVAGAVAKGLPLQAIQNTIMMTLQLCVRKAFAEKAGISPSDPLEKRLAGLKGATIGITGPGAVSDRATRFLLTKYGHLDPNTDAKITQVGGSAAMSGALDAGQIDAFLLSPPNCGATKQGEVLVPPGDVPEFVNYTHEVVYGTQEWIKSHEDVAKMVATAVSMGNNFILQHPDEALKLLQAEFPKVDPAVVEQAFNDTIKPQVKPDGKFTVDMWTNTNTVLVEAGVIAKPIDVSEGTVWTNQYVGDASVR